MSSGDFEVYDIYKIKNGLGISWVGYLGWGEYKVYFGDDGKIHVDTGNFDSEADKQITTKIFNALIDQVIIDR